jgi:hypothetical protein
MKTTRLREDDFYTAVGWLARENKIKKEGDSYQLDQTNLTDEIGFNAGKIYDVLKQYGEVDETFISKIAEIEPINTYCGIGWLAKEGKIKSKKQTQNKPLLKISLIE